MSYIIMLSGLRWLMPTALKLQGEAVAVREKAMRTSKRQMRLA